MGASKSKSKNKRVNRQNNARNAKSIELQVRSDNQYEDVLMNFLKEQFDNDIQTFILNQIVLSVMFFDNYETQISKYFKPNTSSELEKDLNRILFNDQKECIMPDMLFEQVNNRIHFKRQHGNKDSQPLIPQRMFIVHDNIEVIQQDEDHYNLIDKPSVVVLLENSENKGFVKLKVNYSIDGQIKSQVSDNSSTSSVSQSLSEEKDGGFEENTSPGIKEADEEVYTYERVTATKVPQPISTVDTYSSKLPQNWIKEVQVRNLIKELDLDEDDDEDLGGVVRNEKNEDDIDDLYLSHHYCDSVVFMDHFASNVFPNVLGKMLNFEDEHIKKATYISGCIYCNKLSKKGDLVKCELIPSISIPWPAQVAYEFVIRDRPKHVDSRSNILYQWPSQLMVQEISNKLKSVITAKGFIKKRGTNPEMNLEWEVQFPKAEQYLLTKMSHAQMKAFLVIVTLFKTFIEPLTEQKGLLVEHLRTLIFWECEKNYMDWQERMLGGKIFKILYSFYQQLGKGRLQDYFIKSKNNFENIPGKFLRSAQEKIHKILEAPVMHFILALRNLRYKSSKKFYPEFDWMGLYNIITSKDGLKIVNPTIYKTVEIDRKVEKVKKTKLDPEQDWQRRQLEKSRKKTEKLKKEQEKEGEKTVARVSVESIDLEWDHFDNFDQMKKIALLQHFIKHFIEISKVCWKISTVQQARFYSKQAEYLSRLLLELPSCEDIAENWLDVIRKQNAIFEQIAASEPRNIPPNVPKRNSIGPMAEMVINNSVSLNIQNINNSYNSGMGQSISPSRSKLRRGISFKDDILSKSPSIKEEIHV